MISRRELGMAAESSHCGGEKVLLQSLPLRREGDILMERERQRVHRALSERALQEFETIRGFTASKGTGLLPSPGGSAGLGKR